MDKIAEKNTDFSKLREFIENSYKRMFKEPIGFFKHPCLLPVSTYAYQLWDWGCWTSNIAIRQIATKLNEQDRIVPYEKGCVLNFLDAQKEDGSIPIVISYDRDHDLNLVMPHKNVHKPVIAQHTAFIIKYCGDAKWIAPYYEKLEKFISYYENNAKHESGLFYFFDDFALGVDNDPCSWFRPENSSASIYLNTFMYKELGAMAYIANKLGLKEKETLYLDKQQQLKDAINTYCYDEKDGMYYSCDINLRKIDENQILHRNAPRHYSTLIQRIGVWSGFLPLWAGIPNKEQAERVVKENLLDKNAFWSNAGVRSLSKYEKMYRIWPSDNPSSWHGSVWGISNYLVFRGLLKYGYKKEADELAEKTINMFNNDILENGAMHEYYDPDTCKGVFNKDFLSWNMLAYNMTDYFEGKPVVEEF